MGKKEYLAVGFVAGILVGILLAMLIFKTSSAMRRKNNAKPATEQASGKPVNQTQMQK